MTTVELEYAGFWSRTAAGLIDTVLTLMITLPLLIAIYGADTVFSDNTGLIAGPADFLISYVGPAIVSILFWMYRQATPGKMAVGARIVDATTGGVPTTGQYVGRYLAYLVSVFPLGLGLVWIAFDRRKQGWHDKLAGTVVIRSVRRGPEQVVFNPQPSS